MMQVEVIAGEHKGFTGQFINHITRWVNGAYVYGYEIKNEVTGQMLFVHPSTVKCEYRY